MKNSLLLIIITALISISACAQKESAITFDEKYRPQIHFSPEKNWMNDPNGMVYHDGEYHLFYQYNPFGDKWGHMSWGHAVSKDLVSWEHLPVALYEENNVMIFSGSAVVDHNNTSGFGTAENPPMVAIYTGHHTDKELQDQRIAYSTDNGRSWTKFEGNPVIDEDLANFRDPKVLWHDETEEWIMVLALPTEYKVAFYSSPDLINWEKLSEFGPSAATGGIWECPLLFQLPIEGTDEKKWVLQVDLNPGGPAGGSGSQYFIGDFDGKTFTQDPSTEGETRWVDHGPDYYAVQSFDNVFTEEGGQIWMAWMNNWAYAQEIPTSPWRSAMTLPREIKLREYDDGIYLVRKPSPELQSLREDHSHFENEVINGESDLLKNSGVEGNVLEVIAEFELSGASTFGFKVAKGETEETIIGYNTETEELFVDRSNSGEMDFSENFTTYHTAPLKADNNRIQLHFFLDTSSLEVFANDGRISMTERIFPSEEGEGISLFTEGGSVDLISLDVWNLKSIW
jgi:fructan beta-fructosidase